MVRWQDDFAKFTYAGGQAGTFGVWFFPPARLRARVCKNAILSCHLAIFVSLIPFLKGVGCKMKFQNLSYAGGQAGTFGVGFSRPPAYARGICKKRHFKLHPTPSFRHLIAQHPLTPIDPYRSSDRKRATVALLSFHCFA